MPQDIPDTQATRRTDMMLRIVGLVHNIHDKDKLDEFVRTAKEQNLYIEYEPNNPKDPKAVAVMKDVDGFPRIVGHVSRDDLMKIRFLMHREHADRMRLRVIEQQQGCDAPTLLAYPLGSDGSMIRTVEIPLDNYQPANVRFLNPIIEKLSDMPKDKAEEMYAMFCFIRDSLGIEIPQSAMTKLSHCKDTGAAATKTVNFNASSIGVASAGDGTMKNY